MGRFNPRAREGRDAIRLALDHMDYRVSIHAPVRGATRKSYGCMDTGKSFNPRAREGRDARERLQVASSSLFQSTRP